MDDRHQRRHDGVEVDDGIDLAARLGLAEIVPEHRLHLIHIGATHRFDGAVAHGLGADLREQRRGVRLVHETDMPHGAGHHALDHVGIAEHRLEDARVLAPVGGADGLDDGFLGGKVAVQGAGAHVRLRADLLHGRALEAGTDETGLRGLQNALGLLVPALSARHRGTGVGLGIDESGDIAKPALHCYPTAANVHSRIMRVIIRGQAGATK